MSTIEEEVHAHEYDGIKELDNQLPRWWLLLFYFSIAFAVVYLLYYEVLDKGMSAREAYAVEVAAAEAARDAMQPAEGEEPAVLEASTDEAVLAEGKTIFATYCFPCHAPDGGGLVGPNMTDDYFIHGPKFEDAVRTITHGVPEKGMIAWNTTLKPDQILAVASYIETLRGTTPANPKAPEGEHYPATE